MNRRPPKLAKWILAKLLHDDVWKSPLGDFEEYHQYLVENESLKKANRWYWSQVLQFAPSKLMYNLTWILAMFKNYLKISYRSLKNNFSYSFINVFGLAVGLACFVLITLFIKYEYSYDTHHAKSDRIYRIVRHNPLENYLGSSWFALTPVPMAAALQTDYPEVEAAAYIGRSEGVFSNGDVSFKETGISMEGDFFNVFTHQWIHGNPEGAMDDPESIILTESLSRKCFGTENPIGKTIDVSFYGDPATKTITGVIKDIPATSHVQFDYIIDERSSQYYRYNANEWSNTSHYTYIALKEGTDASVFHEKLPAFTKAYIGKSNFYQENPDRLPILELQPLTDIHLKSTHLNFNIAGHGDIKYIYMFGAIALIIVLIACVNYMNLATARSLLRAKEIGVRKVIGAVRSNLIVQFISEAIIISLLSIMTAFILAKLFLPIFNSLSDRAIDASAFLDLNFLLIAFIMSLVVGVFSGSYPAFYMSALKPAHILKSQVKGGKGNRFFRNLLVVGQFTITIVLVISSIVVFRQLDYIQTTDTGLDREQVIVVDVPDRELWDKYETLENELTQNANIISVSSSGNVPTRIGSRANNREWDGVNISIYNTGVGFNFTEMLGLELIAGRTFTKELHKETVTDYLINESTMNALGWTPEEALTKTVELNGQEGPVIGVLKDFNFLSLRLEVEPLVLYSAPGSSWQNFALVKVQENNLQQTLAYMEDTFKKFSPNYPFNYTFLDDSFNNMYRTELRLGSMFNYLTILAMLIACMGLLGLASFIIEQRTKEIGIRKVLGASVIQIVGLVNKDFIKLVALSFVIATPVGWYLMDTWLQDFAYKIELGPAIFLFAGILAIGVALVTVSYKSVKTSLMNPIDSLRNE